MIEDRSGEERPPIAHEGEYIHLGFIVENLEETYHLLRAEGAEIPVEDVKVERKFNYDHVPEGSLKTTDRDGNILDITEHKDEWDGVQLQVEGRRFPAQEAKTV